MVTQTSSESHSSVMNSRFWFDMYTRLKQEVAKEREEFLDGQARERQQWEQEVVRQRHLGAAEQGHTAQVNELRRQLSLRDKAEEIRIKEHGQAIEYVLEELSGLNRQLKGGSLELVIRKIQDIASGAEVGLITAKETVQSNKVVLVLYEVLAMFEVMMKQLKIT